MLLWKKKTTKNQLSWNVAKQFYSTIIIYHDFCFSISAAFNWQDGQIHENKYQISGEFMVIAYDCSNYKGWKLFWLPVCFLGNKSRSKWGLLCKGKNFLHKDEILSF